MDEFNRFEAGQRLAINIGLDLISNYQTDTKSELNEKYIQAFGKLLNDDKIDLLFKANALSIPAEEIFLQEQDTLDFVATHNVRNYIIKTLATRFKDDFLNLYNQNHDVSEFSLDIEAVGKRAIKNKALEFLFTLGTEDVYQLCYSQFENANNMTDEFTGLKLLSSCHNDFREKSVKSFYKKWKHETLVMQKWLMVQAQSESKDTLSNCMELEKDSVFDITVPNLVRSLVGAFVANNVCFHDGSGDGYQYLADKIIELDALNPQVAARLASGYKHYENLNLHNKEIMKEALLKIKLHPNISKNVYEIISKIIE
jgi:aminopeptidase N